ncbi:MAG: sarcosine oxidase subunit gamma family protein [Methylovirgula sp.]
MPEIALERISGFAGRLIDTGAAKFAGVTVQERVALHMATVIARGNATEIARRLYAAYGLRLAQGAKRSVAGDLAFVGTGPRSWLALSEDRSLAERLRHDLEDAAAVSDQSSGYAILRLAGPKLRAMLEKGIGIDLHPRAFQPDDAAVTSCGQVGVILWQIDAAPAYEIAVARSLAAAFSHWLLQSGAEFGVKVLPAA